MALTKSGRITLGQIYNEFKPQSNTAKHSISEYYRRGPNVPDIFENSEIPVEIQNRVNWSDYYGTAGQVGAYVTALPAIDEDDYWRHCEGNPNYWSSLQDNWKQYNTRKDGAYCVMLEVRSPHARIKVAPAKIELDTELGDDSGYEKLLRNTNLDTDYFPFGEWTLTVPRKITRFRILATGAGGSGSVQKITASDEALKGDLDPIIEEGHNGENVVITSENLTVKVFGGLGGGKMPHSTDLDPRMVQVEGTAAVSTNKLYKFADSPQTRKIYGITNAATATESATFLPVITPDNSKKQLIGPNEMDWFAGSTYPINMVWWETAQNGALNAQAGGNGKGGASLWAGGFTAADEHPNQGGPVEPNSTAWGSGGAAGQHAQRGAQTLGGNAAPTAYLGDFETSPGEDITIKVPQGGKQSINLYTDFNQNDKDNFTPSKADIDQYADHPVYGTGFYVGSSYVSKSGKGGDGFVQIFGATGKAYSEMTHGGLVLLDENYNIIQQKFSRGESIKGDNSAMGSVALGFTADVEGTDDPSTPKIYYVAYTGRIRKNGLIESKTKFKSDGCVVSVAPIATQLVTKAPANQASNLQQIENWLKTSGFGTPYPETTIRKSIYLEPDFANEEPIVSGRVGISYEDDYEDVPNVFADTCTTTFRVAQGYPGTVNITFTKVASTDMGIGAAEFNFESSAGVVGWAPPAVPVKIGVGEEYVANSITSDGNCAASYVPNGDIRVEFAKQPGRVLNLYSNASRTNVTVQQAQELQSLSGQIFTDSSDSYGLIKNVGGAKFFVKNGKTHFSCSVEPDVLIATGNVMGTSWVRPVPYVAPYVAPVYYQSYGDGSSDSPNLHYVHYERSTNTRTYFSGVTFEQMHDLRRSDGTGVFQHTQDRNGGKNNGGSSSSESSGCFLTTAIVEMRGEADNGETLNILRKFRDNFLLQNYPNEIEEYYRIAPQLVDAIPKTNSVWGWIGEQIDLSISYINRQENENAYSTYKNMVKVLENDWLIKKEL
jgi:hypothetical protein